MGLIAITCLVFGTCVFVYYLITYANAQKVQNSDFLNDPNINLSDSEKDAINDQITLLEINIERRKEIAKILESELVYCNEKRKASILSRLNTLDTQTYNDMKKLDKLYKDLE